MNVQTRQCDARRIADFLGGRLNDSEQAVLEEHLSTCEACRASLGAQTADDELWDKASRYLRDEDEELESPPGAGDSAAECDQAYSIQHVVDALGPTDDPAMLGRLGAYEISGVVGSGGMGVVLKAFDRSLDRTVAIKVMAPHLATNGAARKRFAREAKAAAAVLHPNVMAIHSVSSGDSLPFLVMPYLRGTSLQKRLDAEGPLPVGEILRIAAQTAAGLAAAHAQGLIHRDIKPANILLEEGVERVAITDFGLARAVDDASMTRTGVVAGTPQYMSPEQARGEPLGQSSDLFSLGSVLYAMCTGRPPFRAESSYGVLRRITDDEPKSIREINPDIPEWLCLLIARLMAKSPDERFANALEVAALLEQCLAHVQQPTSVSLPASLAPHAAGRRSIFNVTRKGVFAMMFPPLVATVDGKPSVSWRGIGLTGLVVSALSVFGFLGFRFAFDVILGSTIDLFPGILLAATFPTVLVLGTQLRTQLETSPKAPHADGRLSHFNATWIGILAVLGIIGMTLLGMLLRQPVPEAPDVAHKAQVIPPPVFSDVVTTKKMATVSGIGGENQECVLRIAKSKRNKQLEWTAPANGQFTATVTASDQLPSDNGNMIKGIILTVRNPKSASTTNIAMSEGGSVPAGTVRFRQVSAIDRADTMVTIADILCDDGTTIPVSILLRDKVDRSNARTVVEAYLAAALADDTQTAALLAKGAPAESKQIESLPKQLNVQRLFIKSVYLNDPAKPTTALATSEAVKLTQKQPNGQRDGLLVLTLTMSEEGWCVTDIDFESEDGAEDELKRFLDANPKAMHLALVELPKGQGTDTPQKDKNTNSLGPLPGDDSVKLLARLQGEWKAKSVDHGNGPMIGEQKVVIRDHIGIIRYFQDGKLSLQTSFALSWANPDRPQEVDLTFDPNSGDHDAQPGLIECDGKSFRLCSRGDARRPRELCPGDEMFYVECSKELPTKEITPQKGAAEVPGIKQPLDRKNARVVAEAFMAAMLSGDGETAKNLAKNNPAKFTQEEITARNLDLKRLGMKLAANLDGKHLAMKAVYVNDPAQPTKALAMSEVVKLKEKQPNNQHDSFLVRTLLSMGEEGWIITDIIDFESEESADRELKKFLEANPSAIEVPLLNADMLPGTDSGSDIMEKPTGKQLGTVLGKPLHESDLNKNTSTEDNLKRLLLAPLTENYCGKHGLDRAEELNAKIKDEKNRRVVRMFVTWWELNRHLYEKHGGRVQVTPFGSVAFDGMRKWLDEREQAGEFQITDPQLKTILSELYNQVPPGTMFAKPDQLKTAFDPALTDRFIERAVEPIPPKKPTEK